MSPDRLLIIGADAVVSEVDSPSLLAGTEEFGVEHLSWKALNLEQIRHSQARALVAIVGSVQEDVQQFLAHLRRSPLPMPTLGIFTLDPCETDLRFAADIVDDFVFTPVRPNEITYRLRRMLGPPPSEAEALRTRLNREYGLTQIVTQTPSFLNVIATIPRIAASEASVLITGETGVGKELCARAIHHLSARSPHPFIPMDCGAVPENLLENEMFGHMRGAYTGAEAEQKGLVALADKGTLFLDEVDSLTLAAQAKLLRLLQEHSYRPLGGERFYHSDARIVAATNGDLEQLLKSGKFRRDLYYRLEILQLRIPPLRERPNDISPLAKGLLDSLALDRDENRKRLSNSALRKLEAHDWPGNVRELFNVLQRAAILSNAPEIGPQDILLSLDAAHDAEFPQSCAKFRVARARAIEKFERAYIAELLEKHHGNITRAAFEAGKDRRAFGRLVGKYDVERRRAANRVGNYPPAGNR